MTDRQSVRVNADGTLIVPPFECAWLTGDGYELRSGSGCVLFEAKGETDVTLIFRPTPGTKRLQPLQRSSAPASGSLRQHVQRPQPAPATQEGVRATPSSTSGLVGDVEPNYTVILGSHRNSCLKIEKNGTTVRQVSGVPGARVGSRGFQPFWVNYHEGVMTVGTGDPCEENISQQWVDRDPVTNLTHIGFSCWDRHVSYRNIQVLPGMRFAAVDRCREQQGETAAGTGAHTPLSLFRLCSQVLVSSLGSPEVSALEAARVAEILLPSTRTLYRACLDYLARHFRDVTTNRCISAEPYASFSDRQLAHARTQHSDSATRHALHARTGAHDSPRIADQGLGEDAVPDVHGAAAAVTAAAAAACDRPVRSFSAPAAPAELARSALITSGDDASTADTHTSSLSCNSSNGSERPARPSVDMSFAGHQDFAHLPTSILCDLLLENTIPVTEKQIFDAVAWWAGGGTDVQQSGAFQDATSGKLNAAPSGNGPPGTLSNGQSVLALDVSAIGLSPAIDATDTLYAAGTCERGAASEARSSAEVCAVLSLIRYTLMTQEELTQVARHPLVAAHPEVQRLVDEARQMDALACATPTGTGQTGASGRPSGNGLFAVENRRLLHLSAPAEHSRAHHTRFQRRVLPASHECAYICDGDQNGVLHFIGTLYGTQAWVNPVLARRVDMKASSPPGRHTDPKALASDHFLRTNWAGPRYVNGAADTWWQLDLGSNHQLIVTYYTLRHDASSDYVRSWALQGSQDGLCWVDLRRHLQDTTLKRAGQYVSWPVMGPAAQTPYRYFRLLLTGPTASQDRPNYFPLSHWELYGYLQRMDLPT